MKPTKIILIFAIIILLALASFGIYKLATKEEAPIEKPKIDLMLKTHNHFTQEDIDEDIQFSIEDSNGTTYLSGILESKIWNVFNNSLTAEKRYTSYTWGENYYVHPKYNAGQNDIYRIKQPTLPKAKEIEISHNGTIKNNDVEIHFTPKQGIFSYMSICVKWSFGILDVSLPNFVKQCNTGSWVNYSSYNEETGYAWLPKGEYVCQNQEINLTYPCSKVENNLCFLPTMPVPPRYSNKADKCFLMDLTLIDNETFSTKFDVRTIPEVNKIDYFTIYFIDKDLVKNGVWQYQYSKDGLDIGMDDVEYNINYN